MERGTVTRVSNLDAKLPTALRWSIPWQQDRHELRLHILRRLPSESASLSREYDRCDGQPQRSDGDQRLPSQRPAARVYCELLHTAKLVDRSDASRPSLGSP